MVVEDKEGGGGGRGRGNATTDKHK